MTDRELDTLIAEKVLDWGVYKNTLVGRNLEFYGDLPNYSTDIKDAMTVFEHLRNSNKWCCLKILSDYHYVWYVTLTPSAIQGGRFNKQIDAEHKPTIIESSESLPEAICLAALRSVGYDVEKKDETKDTE